jgi:hypothetical protein
MSCLKSIKLDKNKAAIEISKNEEIKANEYIDIKETDNIVNEVISKKDNDDYFEAITEKYINSSQYHDEDYDFIAHSLLSFFNEEKSLNIDTTEKLPFISCTVSDDGVLRTYSWDTKEGGISSVYTSIVQYIMPSGKPNALFLNDIIKNFEDKIHPMTLVEYYDIDILKENIYCLRGSTRIGIFDHLSGFITLKLQDDMLVPYPAFNNDISLFFYGYPSGGNPKERITDYFATFNKGIFKISLDYGTRENDSLIKKTLDFVFNGIEFLGDYEIFAKIK